jgi:hypothetical protein
LGLKYLNSLMRIRDGDSSDPGTGMEKSWIRDKHPGSTTLILGVRHETVAKHLNNLKEFS